MPGLEFEDGVQVPGFPFVRLKYTFVNICEMGKLRLALTGPVGFWNQSGPGQVTETTSVIWT